jgi:hypothetical protein
MGDSGEAFALPSAVRSAAVSICSGTRTMNQIEAAVNAYSPVDLAAEGISI